MNPLDWKRQHQIAAIAFCAVGAIAGILFAWMVSPFRQLSSHSVSGGNVTDFRTDARVPQPKGGIHVPCSLIQTTLISMWHGHTLVAEQLSLHGRSNQPGRQRCREF
jgi:hypothetical protein